MTGERLLLARFRALPPEGTAKTLLVAAAVCVVCSFVVSAAAVLLRPLERANQRREQEERVRALLETQPGLAELFGGLDSVAVEARVVELASGEYADWIDAAGFDPLAAAEDPARSIALPPERDPAGIGRRANEALVYLVRRERKLELAILPFHGRGYASTIRGYLALAGDARTIAGITFYEHGETPGIGGEIEDGDWQARWRGKRALDEAGMARIAVAKGEVDPASPDARFEVDGITGATRTCDGLTRMLRFWLGEDGFGPFLERLAEGGS